MPSWPLWFLPIVYIAKPANDSNKNISLLVINAVCSSPQAMFLIATLKVQNLGKG
jgi:hypothetical protein